MNPEIELPAPEVIPPKRETVVPVLKRYQLGMWTRVRQLSDLKPGDIFGYFHPRTGVAIAQHEQGAFCYADGVSSRNSEAKRNEIDTYVFRSLQDALSFKGKKSLAATLMRKP